jgi:DNA mismatch repair protein MutH
MELVLQIFPYANAEIVTAAAGSFGMTLFGLSLGFALLKFRVNKNHLIIFFNIIK